MFSILQRYVYRQLGAVFGVTLCGFTLIMLLYMLMKPAQAGVPPRYLFEIIPLALPYVIGWTLPISILAGCIVTYGRMASDNEVTALRASGIHLVGVVLPALSLGLLLSTVGIYVNDELTPGSSNARRTLLSDMTKDLSLAQVLFEDPILEFGEQVKILAWEVRGEELRDVVIHLRESGDRLSIIRAQTARLTRLPDPDKLLLEVGEGLVASMDPSTKLTSWMQFEGLQKRLEFPVRKDVKYKIKEYPTKELVERLGRGGEEEGWVRSALIAIHGRRSLALSSLAFVLIGVPLGLITRKGSKLVGFGLAVGVMFGLYYPLLVGGKALSQGGFLAPWVGLWTPTVLVGAIGLALLIVLLRK